MALSEKTELVDAIKGLASSSPQTTTAASKTLLKAGLREFSGVRKEVLASEEGWNALIRALSDADSKVVENASGALAQVIGRYRRDLAAFDPMRALLTHNNKQIRTFAVRGLGYLDHPERWNVLIPLLDDKAEPVRREVVMAMINHPKDMSPADRLRGREAVERIAAVAGPELKMITDNAIRVLSSE